MVRGVHGLWVRAVPALLYVLCQFERRILNPSFLIIDGCINTTISNKRERCYKYGNVLFVFYDKNEKSCFVFKNGGHITNNYLFIIIKGGIKK